jgi:hypothetical protein
MQQGHSIHTQFLLRPARAPAFVVPGSGERLGLSNLTVFATMNPSSIGGGRNKLPRSIEALFTQASCSSSGEVVVVVVLVVVLCPKMVVVLCPKNGKKKPTRGRNRLRVARVPRPPSAGAALGSRRRGAMADYGGRVRDARRGGPPDGRPRAGDVQRAQVGAGAAGGGGGWGGEGAAWRVGAAHGGAAH